MTLWLFFFDVVLVDLNYTTIVISLHLCLEPLYVQHLSKVFSYLFQSGQSFINIEISIVHIFPNNMKLILLSMILWISSPIGHGKKIDLWEDLFFQNRTWFCNNRICLPKLYDKYEVPTGIFPWEKLLIYIYITGPTLRDQLFKRKAYHIVPAAAMLGWWQF